MKWRVLRTVCAAVALSALFTPSFSQNYYLVIGAFATENDDIKEFTSYLPGQNTDTAYTLTSNNELLHFYVLKTSNRALAVSRSARLQKEIEEHDSRFLSSSQQPGSPEGNMASAFIAEPDDAVATASSNSSGTSAPSGGSAPLTPKGKFFKFTITSADGNPLPGEVHHVDLERGRELGNFTTNSYIDVLRPQKEEPMTMVCGVFGYKEVEKYVDFSDPSRTEGVYRDASGAWVIPYTLERLEAGDVSVMYNVAFHKDAVFMLPSSKTDLDELVKMMNLNPNYVIKVHAHCNGKGSRQITAMGNVHDYFEPKDAMQIKGSARQLTNLRAEAIQAYLMGHGIDKKRIKLYGWGGSDMLVDEDDANARLNDRIEIEILKD